MKKLTPLRIAGIGFIIFAIVILVGSTCNKIKDRKDEKTIVKDKKEIVRHEQDVRELYVKDSIEIEKRIQLVKQHIVDSIKRIHNKEIEEREEEEENRRLIERKRELQREMEMEYLNQVKKGKKGMKKLKAVSLSLIMIILISLEGLGQEKETRVIPKTLLDSMLYDIADYQDMKVKYKKLISDVVDLAVDTTKMGKEIRRKEKVIVDQLAKKDSCFSINKSLMVSLGIKDSIIMKKDSIISRKDNIVDKKDDIIDRKKSKFARWGVGLYTGAGLNIFPNRVGGGFQIGAGITCKLF